MPGILLVMCVCVGGGGDLSRARRTAAEVLQVLVNKCLVRHTLSGAILNKNHTREGTLKQINPCDSLRAAFLEALW